MTKNKKAIFGMLSMLLVAAVAVAGVVMWLTAKTDVVNNTFTVGKIEATLDEAKVDDYGVPVAGADRVAANTYKLIPGHEYTKDPTVHIKAGSEKCWVFVKVVDGLANAEAATTIADQMLGNGWVDKGNGVWAYRETVDVSKSANDKDLLVFGSFMLKNDVDLTAYANAKITIAACAVQAEGFETADDALSEAKFAESNV